ncbi:MAG: hypothetical protein JO247_03560, partial [Chloroflexi bacterium]|nr:hypothetical protein [Chloroflexota bacterium]
RVTIPMAEGVESLNAAIAAGILLFEAKLSLARRSGRGQGEVSRRDPQVPRSGSQ